MFIKSIDKITSNKFLGSIPDSPKISIFVWPGLFSTKVDSASYLSEIGKLGYNRDLRKPWRPAKIAGLLSWLRRLLRSKLKNKWKALARFYKFLCRLLHFILLLLQNLGRTLYQHLLGANLWWISFPSKGSQRLSFA